jgi:hypothetical protein
VNVHQERSRGLSAQPSFSSDSERVPRKQVKNQLKGELQRTEWRMIIFIVAEKSRKTGRRKAYRVLLTFIKVANVLYSVFFC